MLTISKPADVGMSPSVLDAAKLLYAEAVARNEIAGVVLLVARHGKVVMHEALGWRDRENGIPMTTDTVFNIASMTKPIVSTAGLILAEQGSISLDDPVSKYIPEFSRGRSSRITIKHLMNHTSGYRIAEAFAEPLVMPSADQSIAPTLQSEAAKYPRVGPDEEPGTTYSYSNPGYNTLGAVLEIASGKPLQNVLQTEVYNPLSMADTCQLFGNDSPARLAKRYMMQGAELVPISAPPYPFAAGAGGTASTAWDYAKFCQMYLNVGVYAGRRVLSAASVKLATSLTVRTRYVMPEPEQLEQRGMKARWYYRRDGRALGIDIGYGLGWVISSEGIYSHPGLTGTFAWVDPAKDLIGIILTQSNDARNPGIEFEALVNVALKVSER